MQQTREATHEDFIARVREVAVARALERGTITTEQAENLRHAKLVYGIGNGSYRGICHYEAWENGIGKVEVVEIAATAEENWIQLAGTTIHELGHVLGRWEAGHGPVWKDCADKLGLRQAKAAGMLYSLAAFDPKVREQVASIATELADGSPAFRTASWLGITLRPIGRGCSAGIGTKGGRSRGKGSGSRMIKLECATCGYTVRTTRRWIDEGLPTCGHPSHGRMVEA